MYWRTCETLKSNITKRLGPQIKNPSQRVTIAENLQNLFKDIDRLFGGEGREKTHSIRTGKLEARMNFLSYFKGLSSRDQQKTIRRRLITSKVTVTGQSHFMLIFVLRKVTLPNRINSVP